MTVKRWRQLALWMHVLSSVSWMALALVLFVLLVHGQFAAAHAVDVDLLAPAANASASTGLVLALATPWGLVARTWVLTKFAITFSQLYLGIFVLSGALRTTVATGVAPVPLIVGTVLMASAIAFQAWLSVAKPGGRTPWARGALPTAPA